MPQCKKCNTEKESDQYYANDRTCKECRKAAVRKNRAEKVEYYREYDKARFQSDPNVRARHKRYQQTEAGKESVSRSRKKWEAENKDVMHAKLIEYRAEFPKKYAAHTAVHCAKIKGILKAQPCEECGSEESIHAHHDDYDKPLSIRWLCASHHRQWHMINGEAANAR